MISPSTMASLPGIGSWRAAAAAGPAWDARGLAAALTRVREPVHVVRDGASGARRAGAWRRVVPPQTARAGDHPLLATLPALYPGVARRSLVLRGARRPLPVRRRRDGQRHRHAAHGDRRWRRPGCSASSAPPGSRFERVERALDEIERRARATALAWGVEPDPLARTSPTLEERGRRPARCAAASRAIAASAFMALTPAVVRYAATGPAPRRRRPHRAPAPRVREDLAARGRAPLPVAARPADMLDALVERGPAHRTTRRELAARVPVAEDITVEADTGGHTDNRPLVALLPDDPARCATSSPAQHGYARPIRVGAAGGLGTPARGRRRVRARRRLRRHRLGQPGRASSRGSPSAARRCSPRPTWPT